MYAKRSFFKKVVVSSTRDAHFQNARTLGLKKVMKNHSVFVDFRYLGPSVSDLIFSWDAFDTLWATFGVLAFPL